MSVRQRLKDTLYKIRNPERSENEAAFLKDLGFKRLLFFIPFLLAAGIIMLLAFQ